MQRSEHGHLLSRPRRRPARRAAAGRPPRTTRTRAPRGIGARGRRARSSSSPWTKTLPSGARSWVTVPDLAGHPLDARVAPAPRCARDRRRARRPRTARPAISDVGRTSASGSRSSGIGPVDEHQRAERRGTRRRRSVSMPWETTLISSTNSTIARRIRSTPERRDRQDLRRRARRASGTARRPRPGTRPRAG